MISNLVLGLPSCQQGFASSPVTAELDDVDPRELAVR
jgi:hypothetical protein